MRDTFEFFWHGDPEYPNCEYGQWYMRQMVMDLTVLVEHLPFLKPWSDVSSVVVVNCAEQWMMFCKAVLMGDFNTAADILTLDTPKEQKAAGRKIKPWDEAKWLQWREEIVYWGNYVKFTQHADLTEKIKSVPLTKEFVEASPLDKIWGIGLADTNPLAWDKATWKGLNLLGKALTRLRRDLENA